MGRGPRWALLYAMGLAALAAVVLTVYGRVWAALAVVSAAIVLGWLAGLWQTPVRDESYEARLARLLGAFGNEAQAADRERAIAEQHAMGEMPQRRAPARYATWHGQLLRAAELREALLRRPDSHSSLWPALSEASSHVLAGVSQDGAAPGPEIEYAAAANRVVADMRALSEDHRERSIEAMRRLVRALEQLDPPPEALDAHERLSAALVGYERSVESTPRADVGGPEAAKARTQGTVAAWDELHGAISEALRAG